MNTTARMDFKKTSFAVLSIYAVCIAALLFNALNKEDFESLIDVLLQMLYLILLWILIIAPQLILFLYVLTFQTRWVQLISLILQIIAFVGSLYYHGKVLLLMNVEDQPILTLFSLPAWECPIILAVGLILKVVQSY